MPGILASPRQEIGVPHQSLNRDFCPRDGATALGEHGLVPITNQDFGPVTGSSTHEHR